MKISIRPPGPFYDQYFNRHYDVWLFYLNWKNQNIRETSYLKMV
jgi:hypothetical protein